MISYIKNVEKGQTLNLCLTETYWMHIVINLKLLNHGVIEIHIDIIQPYFQLNLIRVNLPLLSFSLNELKKKTIEIKLKITQLFFCQISFLLHKSIGVNF